MRTVRLVLLLAALFSAQGVFAHEMMGGACSKIAKACEQAGYGKKGTATERFWEDCMKPLALGQTVKGVTIDADTAKACRAKKIDELKKELKEFQAVS